MGTSVTCGNCGTENEAGRKFCKECAARLALGCPSCGATNAADAKFCGECATPLAGGTAPSAVAPSRPVPVAATAVPVAERRLVTILFADLVGFTTLAEGRDAEDTRELLSRYFDLSSDVIGRYGGTVEKFIGDAVMAVWGAPVAREDDAERAVRAGLELLDAVRALGPSIQARAGILTGEAAVTIGATNQGMVAGDLVNTASRLQSVAVPGTVLVGEATQRAASRAIAFEPAGDQTLKGKTAPVPAWRALRVVAERGGRNRSEALEAPFVGRDDELRQLKDLFHATGRDRRARLVSVIGPAGIGKTRLAWEFLKYLDGLVENVWWHDGRSPAYGEGISFWALGEMVRERCGLLETDDESTSRSKIAETLATHVPDPEERRWIEPAMLALLGIASGARSEQLFGAWRTFFERLAATAPVVMVFEDFHFADPGLIDFVDHLLEWSRNVPIYVVTLSRPELLERRPDWGAGKRYFTSLYLEPLTPAAMRELLAGLVPGLPEPAIRAIVERADGIPLYAVETVRMLLAEGRLALEDGAYRPVGDLTNLAVPETLTNLIASRLDGLVPEDRALVSDAAVLGQSFTLAGLSAVSGTSEGQLEPRLRAFVRRELLTLQADPRSPELGQYAFVQALIREVAYNTLARADRKVRHLAAARFFESLGSDEIAGGLAGHYLAAHENAAEGPERDALAAQARIALTAAADRAVQLGSHEQALRLLELALSITPDPAGQADFLERAGESAGAAGHHAAAEQFFERALTIRRKGGDRPATALMIAVLGRAMLSGRQVERALPVLEAAIAEFADLAADPGVVALKAQLARGFMLHDENRRSLEVVDGVLEAAEHADLTAILADALVTRGSALNAVGRLREGLGVIEIGERLAAAAGLTGTVLRAINNQIASLGDVDPRRHLEAAREGQALARRIGDRPMSIQFGGALGYGLWGAGDWDGAVQLWRDNLADEPEPADRLLSLHGVAITHAARGEPVADALDEIARVAADVTDPQVLWTTVDGPAFAAFAAGRLEEAGRLWREGAGRFTFTAPAWLRGAAQTALERRDAGALRGDLEALDAFGFHAPVAELQRSELVAGLAALDGRTGEATRSYLEVVRGLREIGLPLEAAFATIRMTTVLDQRSHELRQAVDEAAELLRRLRAVPFLERLEAVTGRDTPERPRASAEEPAGRTSTAAS
jgi:class 3 adenylate cyclase/tetratricopeptide (TPR) repeat protein